MRPHTKKLSAIGTAIGLVLMASAITPAVAAPVPTALSGATCASLESATMTGSEVSASAVALRRGDTITASVAPAQSGDTIFLLASTGMGIIVAEGPATGQAFTALVDGSYNFTWAFKSSSPSGSTLVWKFDTTCSSTTVSPSPSPSPTATTKPGKGKGKR